jgi:hypothetical protein
MVVCKMKLGIPAEFLYRSVNHRVESLPNLPEYSLLADLLKLPGPGRYLILLHGI